jgi:multidrug efflux pump subunit AcrA (membrane-fusion protein)
MKKYLSFGLALALCTGAAGCGKKKEKAEEKVVPVVKAAAAQSRNLNETLFFVGDVKAQDEATVFSKVTGKLIENKVKEGDEVKKGDVIAMIDRDETGFKFEPSPVDSPLTGTVGRVYLDKGANVLITTPVAFVVDMTNVEVHLELVERYVPQVLEGQKAYVTVDAFPGRNFEGVVSKVSPVVDRQSRTAVIEITIPNHDRSLLSGMFAKIKLVTREHKDVCAVTSDAVLKEGDAEYVFVVEGNQAKKKKVLTGVKEGDHLEVKDGLNIGEQVVVWGQHGLEDGQEIEIKK